MPPQVGSRYMFCTGYRRDGEIFLGGREPFRYRPLIDNITHTLRAGESLFVLAGLYYAPLPRACGFWWVIADFQDPPIHDPTLTLEPGTQLIIPSLTTLENVILSERRRREH